MKLPKELLEVERKTVETVNLPSDNNHDPSNILYDQGTYYLWYTQHDNERPYDHFADCKIMCCTSKDGIHWEEGKDALLPAESGWDCAGVLTANVIHDKGRFYMFYTGEGTDFAEGKTTRRCCGLAAADTPDGPFERLGNEPVLQWEEEGSWDDEAVDDISAVFFQNRWLVYFKGSRLTEPDGDKTMLGLAWADTITGPYHRYEGNPVIRGHAFSIWPYKEGLCLLSGLKHREGEGRIYGDNWNDPEGIQYLYYSEDGIHFEPCAPFPNRASGIFIPEGEDQKDITKYWGVSVATADAHKKRYIERFDFIKKNPQTT